MLQPSREFQCTTSKTSTLIEHQSISSISSIYFNTRTFERRHPRAQHNLQAMAGDALLPWPGRLTKRILAHLRLARQPRYCGGSPRPPRRQRADQFYPRQRLRETYQERRLQAHRPQALFRRLCRTRRAAASARLFNHNKRLRHRLFRESARLGFNASGRAPTSARSEAANASSGRPSIERHRQASSRSRDDDTYLHRQSAPFV